MALAGLGFRRSEAVPVVGRLLAERGGEATLDSVLRDALKELAR
ncbi:Holliday junction ATP-dependent DNA helicase RuvA [Acetobacter orientalis]|nr:Holliday junction ATP-dependent DNA helicase RuvA [Acetobacter orientalis]